MADLERFTKIERARPRRPERPAEEKPSRFDDAGGGASLDAVERTGAQVERFAQTAEATEEAPLRVKEDDGGQPFLRCCHCKGDNSVGAARCRFCDRALDTAEQRRFNEDVWHQAQAERAEQQRAAEELAAMRRSAFARQRVEEAMRQLADLRIEGGRRHWAGALGSLPRGAVLDVLMLRLLRRILPAWLCRTDVVLGAAASLNLLFLFFALHWDEPRVWVLATVIEVLAALRIWTLLDEV